MKTATIRLDEQSRATLLASTITGNRLKLPAQLDRADYVRVAKAIEAAGGKWNKKEDCHIFPGDVREAMGINGDSIEIVNQQQTFQSFNTPGPVVSLMMEHADLCAGLKVLEPSAGTGNLVLGAIMHGIFQTDIVAVEIDAKKAASLKCRTICADFLTCEPLGEFDRILMNPPFTRRQDIKHIEHALTFLAPGGLLAAICANGPKQRETFAARAVEWLPLEPGAFKESGTNVSAALLIITK